MQGRNPRRSAAIVMGTNSWTLRISYRPTRTFYNRSIRSIYRGVTDSRSGGWLFSPTVFPIPDAFSDWGRSILDFQAGQE